MNSIILEGTVETAPCETCKAFCPATYSYGPVTVEQGFVVDGIMRATCNQCGSVVATAPQSAHRFKAALDDRQHRRTTIRLPRELVDFISLKLSLAGAEFTHAELYLRALLLACRTREDEIGARLQAIDDPVLHQPLNASINLTLNTYLSQVTDHLKKASSISNLSEIIRRLLVLADDSMKSQVEHQCLELAYAYA